MDSGDNEGASQPFDFSMCLGTGCPERKICHRAQAGEITENQSVANFDETRKREGCEFFWKIPA